MKGHPLRIVHQMNPFERLAETLDKIPSGFPSSPGGEHLRVLEWIFSPQEAELASKLRLSGETSEEISARIGGGAAHLTEVLESMAEKGQISAFTSGSGLRKYALMPFVVGIYEEQLGRMDPEFAARFEDYFRAGFQGILTSPPSGFKVIPVNRVVNTSLEVHPFEKAEELVNNAKSWGVRDCICKKQQSLIGNECRYPRTVCLLLHPNRENVYEHDDLTEPISRERALQLLREAEDSGLVHCTLNVDGEKSIRYICNCCTCCCGYLRGASTAPNPRNLVRTDYLASVDSDLCTGCESCIERCQMGALSIIDGVSSVDERRCIGCGVCATVCPESALGLVKIPSSTEQPADLIDWMTQRAISRGIDPSDLL
jgi:electron transport complex protein RnfB